MLEELRRCNSIGNSSGFEFLINVLLENKVVSIREIKQRSSFQNEIRIRVEAAIAFLEYLNLATRDGNMVTLTKRGTDFFFGKSRVEYSYKVCKLIFELMIQEGIFDGDGFIFDEVSGKMCLKLYSIPLSHAVLRNFLIENNAFEPIENEEIAISDNFENFACEYLAKRKLKMSLQELMKIKELESQQGEVAEKFVLDYEKNRLQFHDFKDKIKRISDYDVTAGYDLVSFESIDDKRYNRFIEVKSYSGEPHFYWSDNEVATAKVKGNTYYLCLVDISKIGDAEYVPLFIRNPIENIFNTTDWCIETSTYKIKKM